MKKDARRTPLGDSIETPSRVAAPPTAKTHWRMAKWKGSLTCIRAAAAGLLPKLSSTPRQIRMPMAPSSR